MLQGFPSSQNLQAHQQGCLPMSTGLASSSCRARLRRHQCATSQHGHASPSSGTSAVGQVPQPASHVPHPRRKWQRHSSLQVDLLSDSSRHQVSMHHLDHLLDEPQQQPHLSTHDELDLHYSLGSAGSDLGPRTPGGRPQQGPATVLHPPVFAGTAEAAPTPMELALRYQQQQQQGEEHAVAQQRQQRTGRHRKWEHRQHQSDSSGRSSRGSGGGPNISERCRAAASRAWFSTGVDPRILTRKLSTCQSFAALHQAYLEHRDAFNHVHVACAMNRLAKCPAQGAEAATTRQEMVQALELMFVHHVALYSAREVANALWAWAKLSHQPSPDTRQAVCAAITARGAAMLSRRDIAPQALANMAYGLAVLGWREPHVWSALTAATLAALSKQRQEQDRTDSDISSSSSSTQQQHVEFGHVQQHRQHRQRPEHANGGVPGHPNLSERGVRFAPVDLAGVAWSFAFAKQYSPQLYDTLLEVAQDQLHEFCALDLSNVLWACATVHHTPHKLFDAATPAVLTCMHGFNEQGLANVAWAYAASGAPAAGVIKAVCRHALPVLHAFLPMHFAQLTWAMVRTKQVHPTIMRAALASAHAAPQQWTTRNLAMLLYSTTTSGFLDKEVLAQLQPLLLQRLQQQLAKSTNSSTNISSLQHQHPHQQPARVNWQDVSQIVWAHAQCGAYDAEIFGLAVQLCLSNTDSWLRKPAAFQSLVWSLGYAGHYDEALFTAAAQHIASGLAWTRDGMSPSQLAGILVPLASMQHIDAGALAAACQRISSLCHADPHALNTETLVNVVWSLAMLDHPEPQALQHVLPVLAARWRTQLALEQQPLQRRSRRMGRLPQLLREDSEPEVLQEQPAGSAASSSMMILGNEEDGSQDSAGGSEEQALTAAASGPIMAPGGKLPLSQYLLSNKQLAQVFQVCLWLQDMEDTASQPAQPGQAAQPPGQQQQQQQQRQGCGSLWQLLPGDMLEAAHQVWLSQTQTGSVVSSLQQEVFQALGLLGLRVKLENLSHDGLFSIDCLVEFGGHQIAVEVNGPVHYSRSQPPRLIGSKALRDRLVAQRGYVLLNLPHWEWAELAGDRVAAQHYLLHKLSQVVGRDAARELQQLTARIER